MAPATRSRWVAVKRRGLARNPSCWLLLVIVSEHRSRLRAGARARDPPTSTCEFAYETRNPRKTKWELVIRVWVRPSRVRVVGHVRVGSRIRRGRRHGDASGNVVDRDSAAPQGTPCEACGCPVEPGDKFCPACGCPNSERGGRHAGRRGSRTRPTSAARIAAARWRPILQQRSYICPFCDSTYVAEFSPEQTGRQRPEFVIGFAVTPEQARDKFYQWIRQNSWFRPGDLRAAQIVGQAEGHLPAVLVFLHAGRKPVAGDDRRVLVSHRDVHRARFQRQPRHQDPSGPRDGMVAAGRPAPPLLQRLPGFRPVAACRNGKPIESCRSNCRR